MNRKKTLLTIIILTVLIVLLMIIFNSGTKYNNISISEDKWNKIISSRNENQNLVLKNIKFNDYSLIIDENKSTLYYSLINDSKTKYNPDVSFRTSDRKIKIAILSDEITDEKVLFNYEFKIMIYNDSEYHIYNLICTKFPILNISYNTKNGNKKKNIPIEIYLFNNLKNTPNRITKSSGKLNIIDNGQDSVYYTFSLFKISPGRNERENKISIFNMDPRSEYILSAINNEQENIDSFDEINKERKDNNYHVELFVNNEHIGPYSLKYNMEKENRE